MGKQILLVFKLTGSSLVVYEAEAGGIQLRKCEAMRHVEIIKINILVLNKLGDVYLTRDYAKPNATYEENQQLIQCTLPN